MSRNDRAHFAPAFTLVELILVMALLATLMALAVPSLSRSIRDRNLDQEAKRFVALTEYARSEAISEGVPMSVWIDAESGHFGVEPKTGYSSGQSRQKEYSLNPDVHFDLPAASLVQGVMHAIEFSPDGTVDPSSMASVRMVDRFKSTLAVSKTTDGWGYEVLRETP